MLLPGELHPPSFCDSVLCILFLESSRASGFVSLLGLPILMFMEIYLNFVLFLGS